MPELPDITAYIAALEPRILGQTLERVRLHSVFVLRTADPPITSVEGRAARSLSRLLVSDWPRTLDELEALKRR